MSIIKRLWAASSLLALIFVISVGAGFYVSREMLAVKSEADAAAIAMRNHVEIDMMHDALRATFYAALNAAQHDDAAVVASVKRDLTEYTDWIERLARANRQLPLADELRRQIAASDYAIGVYATNTARLVNLALADPANAQRQIPEFQKEFKKLEVSNEKTSDVLQGHLANRSGEVRNLLQKLQKLALFSVLAIVAAFYAFIFYLQTKIVNPVTRVTRALNESTELREDDRARNDEIGKLANSVADFTTALEAQRQAEIRAAEAERLTRETRDAADREARAIAEQERKRALVETAVALEQQLKHLTDMVVQTSGDLKGVAANLATAAVVSRDEATETAAAAAQTLDGVLAIVDATDELSISVSEISTSVEPMIEASQNVEHMADEASARMAALNKAAEKVGAITSLISAIASQTNLLALNATIEAAHAGEAGHGFAVVANEVKQLAQQTADATAEIDSQIADIALAAGEMGSSIGSMANAIAKLGGSTARIATTAKQQRATTSEIATTIQQAATGTEIMRNNLARVDDQARATATNAELVQRSADILETNVATLNEAISEFIANAKIAA